VLELSICVPVGGRHIANDLALASGIPLAEAEQLKIMESTRRRHIPDEGFLRKQHEMIHAIVQYRAEEIFDLVKRRLADFCDEIASPCASVHLTGGCALQPGICEAAEKVLGLPALRARVKGSSGPSLADPRLACAIGLTKLVY
jgi:cell division protein FtsA